MTLQEHCHQDKPMLIAMHALVRECAAEAGLSLEGCAFRPWRTLVPAVADTSGA